MWCVCRTSGGQWEESFVEIDWNSLHLVASHAEELPEKVCKLDGLLVSRSIDMESECTAVTNGEYSAVFALNPKDSALSCVIGIPEKDEEIFARWLADCETIASYMATSSAPDTSLVQDMILQIGKDRIIKLDRFHHLEVSLAHLLHTHTTSVHLESVPCEDSILYGIRQCVNLERICIQNCDVKDTKVLCNAILVGGGKKLKKLDVRGNSFGDQGTINIAQLLAMLPVLEFLDISANGIGVVGAEALASTMNHSSSLKYLNMSSNPQLGDYGVASLFARVGCLNCIETIELSNCGLRNRMALNAMVMGIEENRARTLKILDIQDNTFESQDVQYFLQQISVLGVPSLIRIGKKNPRQLLLGLSCLDDDTKQMVDLGFTPDDEKEVVGESFQECQTVHVHLAKDISIERLVTAIGSLVGIPLCNVLVLSEQKCQAVIGLRTRVPRCNEKLVSIFQQGHPLLHLLHVKSISVEKPFENQKVQREKMEMLSVEVKESTANESVNMMEMDLFRLLQEFTFSHLEIDMEEFLESLGYVCSFLDMSRARRPLVTLALQALMQCTAPKLWLVKSYLEASNGDCDSCLRIASINNFESDEMDELEVSLLRSSIIADNTELFGVIMEGKVYSVPLADVIYESRKTEASFHFEDSPLPIDPVLEASLVKELFDFPRLNSKWTPRQLCLQYLQQVRIYPLLIPSKSGHIQPKSKIGNDQPESYWKTADEFKIETCYEDSARRISRLLLEAMNNCQATAATEVFGIAYTNREIGLVDELVAQLMCQVSFNPCMRSTDAGWKLLIICVRLLAPSKAMRGCLGVFVDNFRAKSHALSLTNWCKEALSPQLLNNFDENVNHVICSDAAVRLEMMQQVLNDKDRLLDVKVLCVNGTGVKASVLPFTSFKHVLHDIHHGKSHYLTRYPYLPALLPEEFTAHEFESRWKDFVFKYKDENDEAHVLPWEADAFWWSWKLQISNALKSTEGWIPELHLEMHITGASLWYLSPETDMLRTELVYWQASLALKQGNFSVGEAAPIAYAAVLSAAIHCPEGMAQFISMPIRDKLRACLAHVPKAVYQSNSANRRSREWLDKFSDTVDRFTQHLHKCSQRDLETNFSMQRLQLAYIAYLEMWPLSNGVIIPQVRPLRHKSDSKLQPCWDSRLGKMHPGRIVINCKGIFLLVLSRDTYSNHVPSVYWWSPLEKVAAVSVHGSLVLVRTSNGDEIDLECKDPSLVHHYIVAQCTSNLADGSPSIPLKQLMLEFSYSFLGLMPPPDPPVLIDTRESPVAVDIVKRIDLGTTACILRQTI